MRLAWIPLLLLALVTALAATATACPLCEAPSLTLTEQLTESDDVVLVKWVSAQKAQVTGSDDSLRSEEVEIPGSSPAKTEPAKTTLEVVEVVRSAGGLKKGDTVTLPQYRSGKPGDLYLLLGAKAPVGKATEWGMPLEVTQASFSYVKGCPDLKVPTPERLRYFVKYLEFPDELVATDAYGEFANAPWEDIKQITDDLPRERLRTWVANPETNVTRLPLYGLLLGLSGKPEDAELMAKKIAEPTQDFRLGIDGVMSGYLLIAGEKGLKLLEDTKLHKEAKCPFSETYSAMQALRFMWTYGDGKIEKERLRQSMRLLLDRTELADLVVTDLARWQDWSVQDRLMQLYGTEGYDIPAIKRSIVRYMLVSAKEDSKDPEANPAEHVRKGRDYVEQLREKDPDIVRQAERFMTLG